MHFMITNLLPSPDEMYAALVGRDSSYDGICITAVRTTGIFCRPSCPARKPHRENVEFFADSGEALLAGYRPCRRCKPLQPKNAALMARLLTPLGPMAAAATEKGVCLLEFADRSRLETQIQRLKTHLGCAVVPGRNGHLAQLEEELKLYFQGGLRDFSVPLVIAGSDFQRAAWEFLRKIPYGETRSYADQARTIGRSRAQRAVGRANGDNRLAILIPCHRVIRGDGSISGYGGGVLRKRFLLELERKQGSLPL